MLKLLIDTKNAFDPSCLSCGCVLMQTSAMISSAHSLVPPTTTPVSLWPPTLPSPPIPFHTKVRRQFLGIEAPRRADPTSRTKILSSSREECRASGATTQRAGSNPCLAEKVSSGSSSTEQPPTSIVFRSILDVWVYVGGRSLTLTCSAPLSSLLPAAFSLKFHLEDRYRDALMSTQQRLSTNHRGRTLALEKTSAWVPQPNNPPASTRKSDGHVHVGKGTSFYRLPRLSFISPFLYPFPQVSDPRILLPRCSKARLPTTPLRQPLRTNLRIRQDFASGSPTEQRPDFKNDLDMMFKSDGERMSLVGWRCSCGHSLFSRLLRLSSRTRCFARATPAAAPIHERYRLRVLTHSHHLTMPQYVHITTHAFKDHQPNPQLECFNIQAGVILSPAWPIFHPSTLLGPFPLATAPTTLRRCSWVPIDAANDTHELIPWEELPPGFFNRTTPTSSRSSVLTLRIVAGLYDTRGAHSVPSTCLYVFNTSCSIINVHLQEGFPFTLSPSPWGLVSRVSSPTRLCLVAATLLIPPSLAIESALTCPTHLYAISGLPSPRPPATYHTRRRTGGEETRREDDLPQPRYLGRPRRDQQHTTSDRRRRDGRRTRGTHQ
ncbi:hypothetical protein NLJ89_g10533 [Agrocybe chaxingu]|uniref:Uncharacterized protein n=1 Tax=Agrocybe chaxingu TaxID=84603 RepID=A0A9W8JQK0_9AGAR|nr:hypothetical protein NLJ89_g10533 [Agrocybe chaxingu]